MLRVLGGEAVHPPPVWAMRQAGRCLASYRAIREEIGDFKQMVQTPEIAATLTCLPVHDLGVDAAIIFSDILVVPEAMGVGYALREEVGPVLDRTIRTRADVAGLQTPPMDEAVDYVMGALRIARQRLPSTVTLVGFSGSPWTLLAYMVEGHGSKTFAQARRLLYAQPTIAHEAMEKLTTCILDYAQAQVAAGAQVIQLFDPLAELLPYELYATAVLPYVRMLCAEITVPVIFFAKGTQHLLAAIATLPCACVGVDWCCAWEAADKLPQVLQGNTDPALLYADNEVIIAKTQAMLRQTAHRPYIANLGHGIYPDTEEAKVKLWVRTVQAGL